MKYYLIEESIESNKYNAGSKARNDVACILEKNQYKPIYLNLKNPIETKKIKKIKQFYNEYKNYLSLKDSLKNIEEESIIIIQYPLINDTLFYDKILRNIEKKNITTVALIHDVPYLRNQLVSNFYFFKRLRLKRKDLKYLKEFNKIIAHNSFMKNELIKIGIDSKKIYNLELFDYLNSKSINTTEIFKDGPIIIAGNLSPIKAKYLNYLKNLKIKFNLYGVGMTEEVYGSNIVYKGKFLPDELIDNLEGSFGLVWDGEDINSCTGNMGEYLKYNNPHKASLYLTANIPIIVWKKSALAKFVEKNKVGICVNSLDEIEDKINKLTNEEYSNILKNVKIVSKKTSNGMFLEKVLNEVENE